MTLTHGRERSRLPFVMAVLLGVVALVAVYLIFAPESAPEPDTATGPCIPLEVNSSTEKAGLIGELADRYNDLDRVFDGQCATVTVGATTSGLAKQQLAAGWDAQEAGAPEPQAWLPTSSLWVEQLEHERKGDLVHGEPKPVTSSVLTVAMPERMAQVLRAQYPEPTWSDILRLVKQGWKSLGHDKWGRFALGRDNPTVSTSGLAGTIALYHAAAQEADVPLTKSSINDQGDIVPFVHGVESSVAQYGEDATKFMELLYEEDRKRPEVPFISGMVVQEQLAYLYNKGAPGGDPQRLGSGRPNDRLIAIHPTDGTVELDHPFVTLASGTDDQRAAAEDFRRFLLEPAQQKRFAELGFRGSDGKAGEDLVQTLGMAGEHPPRVIPMPEPALVKEMLAEWDSVRRPARVLLLLDVSGSMDKVAGTGSTVQQTKLELVKPAVLRALELLGDDDEVGVWSFSTGYREHVEISRVKDVRARLPQVVEGLRARGSTDMYESVRAAHETMVAGLEEQRINAIVLMTDGKNRPQDFRARRAMLREIDTNLVERSVRVYTIPFGADADVATLDKIAAASKSPRYDATDPADIDDVFVEVFTNFAGR